MEKKEKKPTFIKYCCFSLSSKSRRVNHPVCEPQRTDAKSWTQTEVTGQTLRAVRGGSVETSTCLRLLIPSHSALPQGRMQSPECEACPLFFGTYPKAGTRCQSLQTAQNQANKKSPSLPTPQHLRGTEDALQYHPLVYGVCHLS